MAEGRRACGRRPGCRGSMPMKGGATPAREGSWRAREGEFGAVKSIQESPRYTAGGGQDAGRRPHDLVVARGKARRRRIGARREDDKTHRGCAFIFPSRKLGCCMSEWLATEANHRQPNFDWFSGQGISVTCRRRVRRHRCLLRVFKVRPEGRRRLPKSLQHMR